MTHEERQMLAADARTDQQIAEAIDFIRSDRAAFYDLAQRLNDAVYTRETFAASSFSREERYVIARLADLACVMLVARMLERNI